jgi:uncharacterized protein
VIVLDVNLLLYAYSESATLHREAADWLERQLQASEVVALPWHTTMGFLRLSTDPRMYREPYSMEEASLIIEELFRRANVASLAPGTDHWTIFRGLVRSAQVRSKHVSDAHLAAMTIEHGATLHTTDRDFARFPGLKWKNPLE